MTDYKERFEKWQREAKERFDDFDKQIGLTDKLGEGAKANHLAYIGDASVGADVNIGAGTIFCNYDGEAKHRSEVGEGAFIGSNSALVSPVKIGDGAYVATGSVITDDVPADALVFGRARQVVKENRAKALRAKAAAGKKKGQ